MKKAAVFLDRDGTINRDPGYLSSHRQLRFFPRARKGLKLLAESGFLLFVVTNQSGIGRGFFTWEQLDEIHDRLREILAADGIRISEIAVCPHHPEENCDCRKPSPRLVLDLVEKYSVNPGRSFFVGDKISDIQSGRNAGLRTVLMADPEKKSKPADADHRREADYVAPDLYRAAQWIVRQK